MEIVAILFNQWLSRSSSSKKILTLAALPSITFSRSALITTAGHQQQSLSLSPQPPTTVLSPSVQCNNHQCQYTSAIRSPDSADTTLRHGHLRHSSAAPGVLQAPVREPDPDRRSCKSRAQEVLAGPGVRHSTGQRCRSVSPIHSLIRVLFCCRFWWCVATIL